MKTTLFAGLLVAALAAPAAADRAEDDLQVVKKAVTSSSTVAAARPPAEEPPAPRAEARPRKGGPQWFRVRIEEKAGKRAKVKVNLPLDLVRSFGEDWPVAPSDGCRKDHHCPTLGEILRALDSGQSLVEIDSDESTVRVWVE
jgi:hypothetical protein